MKRVIFAAFCAGALAMPSWAAQPKAKVQTNNDVILHAWSWSFNTIRENMNCLLYTSPSPRDSGTSRMPSSA